MSPATKALPRERLLPVALYGVAAARYGIRETAETLMLSGRLTLVHVGRADFYPWSDLVAAMPEWAQKVTRYDTDAELRIRETAMAMHAAADRLETLAHRVLRFPHMDVDDEVAEASVLPREGALRAFDSLCTCLARRDLDGAKTVLDLLTGRLR